MADETQKDDKVIERKSAIPLDFANLARLIVKDIVSSNIRLQFFKKYKKEDVIKYLENPEKNEKNLRSISRFLYNISSHYRRLINYFATMPNFAYIVEPYNLNIEKINISKFKSQYEVALELLEKMNLKHEMLKILKIAYKEDIFYGYEHETDDSYFIQQLNSEFCRISSIEDGCYNFEFDFSYFDSKKNLLESYPDEFKTYYNKYLTNKKQSWYELNSNKTICIKINEELDYIFPPFSGVFEALFDLEDYKSLKKAKEELGNYKVLIEHIPMRKDSEVNNDFTIDLDLAKEFHNKSAQSLPEQVGLILSPMEITSESFDKDKAETDNVANAERDYWSSAGVSQLLFNSKDGGSIGLNRSIESDEILVFGVLRQIERWINRKFKNINKQYKFKINILNVTQFNQKDTFESLLKAAQFGMPTKLMVCATLGMTPNAITNMAYLENDILGLIDKWIPLKSTHTQSNNEAGAPQKDENDLSDKGTITRDTESNADKAK